MSKYRHKLFLVPSKNWSGHYKMYSGEAGLYKYNWRTWKKLAPDVNRIHKYSCNDMLKVKGG